MHRLRGMLRHPDTSSAFGPVAITYTLRSEPVFIPDRCSTQAVTCGFRLISERLIVLM